MSHKFFCCEDRKERDMYSILKRSAVFLVMSVMVLSLAACGGGSSADSRAASGAGNEAFTIASS